MEDDTRQLRAIRKQKPLDRQENWHIHCIAHAEVLRSNANHQLHIVSHLYYLKLNAQLVCHAKDERGQSLWSYALRCVHNVDVRMNVVKNQKKETKKKTKRTENSQTMFNAKAFENDANDDENASQLGISPMRK